MVFLFPFFSVSWSGVDSMIPLWVSLWYRVCMLDGSPLTTTLLMRRSCHEPPILSGVPPAIECIRISEPQPGPRQQMEEYLRWSPKPKSSVSNSNVSIVHKEIETRNCRRTLIVE